MRSGSTFQGLERFLRSLCHAEEVVDCGVEAAVVYTGLVTHSIEEQAVENYVYEGGLFVAAVANNCYERLESFLKRRVYSVTIRISAVSPTVSPHDTIDLSESNGPRR